MRRPASNRGKQCVREPPHRPCIYTVRTSSTQFQKNIYDTLTIFGFNSIKSIKNQIDASIKNLEENQLIGVYKIFYLCYSEDIIVFLKKWIENEDSEEFDFNEFELPKSKHIFRVSPKISLLSLLFHTKYYVAALQLTLKILIKKLLFCIFP